MAWFLVLGWVFMAPAIGIGMVAGVSRVREAIELHRLIDEAQHEGNLADGTTAAKI